MTPSLAIDDPVLSTFAAEVGSNGPIAVAGGRTRWDHGGSLAADARIIEAPQGIVEYRPDEMTVTVRAGTSVEELHAELAEAGQRTALPERGGSVGGALMVGENGPFVAGRGLLRASLLQVRYVSADGALVTGGGPTVKNVSGFDIPRIMVGSLGTLGLVAEAIIRTNPVPATHRFIASSDVDPFAVPDVILRPGCITWDGSTTTVMLEGHEVDVDADAARLAELGSFADVDGLPELPAHRWSLPPSDVRLLGAKPNAPAVGAFVALVGVGTVYASNPQPQRSIDPTVRLISDRMKNQFDPTGRLNPGRSVLPFEPNKAGAA